MMHTLSEPSLGPWQSLAPLVSSPFVHCPLPTALSGRVRCHTFYNNNKIIVVITTVTSITHPKPDLHYKQSLK